MVLVRHEVQIDPEVLRSLNPILIKLANACIACQQKQELAERNERIRIERNMMRTMLENMPVVLFVLDTDGMIRVSEGRGLSELGTTPAASIGHSVFDLFQSKPEIVAAVSQAIVGVATSITVKIRGIDYQVRYEPLQDEEGVVTGVVGAALNISERVQAERMLDQILQSVGEGIVAINRDGEILLVNARMSAIFGHTREELLGQDLQMLMPEKYRKPHAVGMERYRQEGKTVVMNQLLELEGIRKNGEIFPMELYATKSELGNEELFIGTIRDITHRKELDRMRDNFTATVSHELRTPLASTMGWIETLLSGAPGPLTDAQERFLNIAYASAERLNTLVEEILTVYRVQRDELKLNYQPFVPSNSLHAIVEMIEPLANNRAITLEVEDDWPAEVTLLGDAARLEQVLNNLLGNAIKFSHESSVVRVLSEKTDNSWRVTIKDDGIGIPEDELPNLFDRFSRASTATRAEIQGSGLGLYVCKAIIEGHSGTLKLTSELGVGTTVWFDIPLGVDQLEATSPNHLIED
jgi:PAS domain S-box-containing protein